MLLKKILQNKKANAISLLILFPILIISLFVIFYEIDMTKCSNAVEDASRVCIAIAKSSRNYDEALQNVQNYCNKLGKFAPVTPKNLYIVDTSASEEVFLYKGGDGFSDSLWTEGALIELRLTKYSDYYGATAFQVCKPGTRKDCTPIVSSAKSAKIRAYIDLEGDDSVEII